MPSDNACQSNGCDNVGYIVARCDGPYAMYTRLCARCYRVHRDRIEARR